eukprot:scpid93203/ scgid0745/ 
MQVVSKHIPPPLLRSMVWSCRHQLSEENLLRHPLRAHTCNVPKPAQTMLTKQHIDVGWQPRSAGKLVAGEVVRSLSGSGHAQYSPDRGPVEAVETAEMCSLNSPGLCPVKQRRHWKMGFYSLPNKREVLAGLEVTSLSKEPPVLRVLPR